MFRKTYFVFAFAAVVGVMNLIGCSQQQPAPAPSTDAPDAMSADGSSAKIEAAMAKLSAEDRQAAVAQRVCPVTGEPLGSMGKPIKITQGDRHLFVCCAGCEEEAKAKFDEFYAQLNQPSETGNTP
jgi:hypothetical protein